MVEEVVDLENKVCSFDRWPDFADCSHLSSVICKVCVPAPFVACVWLLNHLH